MENQINTGNLDTLKSGQTLLVQAIKVNGDKIQLEFAEHVQDQVTVNVLGMFNESDSRFQRRPRRAWLTAEPKDAARHLGIDVDNNKNYRLNDMDKMVMELNVLNPVIAGQRLRVQITEQVAPTSDWDLANIDRSAKRRGRDGDFILHNGMHIFTKQDIVFGEPKHTFLEADPAVTTAVAGNVDTDTGEIFS